MAITKKQQELDVIKWEKSEKEGKDACGTFDYCEKCDKALENPCDKAYSKFNKSTAKKSAKPKKEEAVKPAKAVKALKAATKTAKTATKKAAK